MTRWAAVLLLVSSWFLAPSVASAQHAGHGGGAMEATAPRTSQPERHLKDATTTLLKVDAALEKLATSINGLGAPREGRADIRPSLLALAGEVQRTRGAIGQMTADPAVGADGAAAESLHAAARSLEQLTKTMEGLTKNVGRALDR